MLGWGDDVGGMVFGAGVGGCDKESLGGGDVKSLPMDGFTGGGFGLGATSALLPWGRSCCFLFGGFAFCSLLFSSDSGGGKLICAGSWALP